MIGNDIVDLRLATIQSNWRRKGFLNKIFTQTEQLLILESKDPFQFVWLLWSMKESAYKVYVQQHSKRFFAPQKFECSLKNSTEGVVFFGKNEYRTTTTFTGDYIYSIAFLKTEKNTQNICFELGSTSALNERKETYRQLKLAVSKKHHLSFNDLEVKKTSLGVPLLYHKNNEISQSFSLTHHGNYGAIAIEN